MDTLEQFIQSNPDPRELKRALAVQMSQRGHSYREIRSGASSFNRICYCLPSTLPGSRSGGTEIELLGHPGVSGCQTEAEGVKLVAQSVFQGGGTPEAIPGKMPADLTLASDD